MIDFSQNPHLEPDCTARRLAYRCFLEIFKGAHKNALAELSERVAHRSEKERHLIYIALNLPGLISRKMGDFLVGEPPIFLVPESDAPTMEVLEEALNLRQALYESALAQSYHGDVIWRLRVDADSQLCLEQIDPANYYVETLPGNPRVVTGQAVAYVVKSGKSEYLRVEHHEPGRILHEAWLLDGAGKCRARVPLTVTDGEFAPPDEELTRISAPLLIHFVNYRAGTELWGLGDYADLVGVFDAINNRLSSIDRILGRHANPKLVTPRNLTDGTLDSNKDLFIVESPEEAKSLFYVTWEGQLRAAFEELEQLIEKALWLAEMSPAVLGLDKSGIPASGVALRLGFLNTEHKTNRKKLYLGPALVKMLQTASELGAAWQVPGVAALSKRPTIRWQDGLPKIFTELAADLVSLSEAGLVSTETAIAQLWDYTPEEAKAEMDRIKAEREAKMPAGLADFENGGRLNQLDQDQDGE